MWQRYYGRYGNLGRQENFERCLTAMLAHNSIQALSPDPERIRLEFWQGPPIYSRLFALIHEHFAESVDKRRWGAQIGLIEDYADCIFTDYPAARMIHMVRDPRTRRQRAQSKQRQRVGKMGWEMARWLHSAELARRNQARFPDRYLVVICEALLADRRSSLQRICDFLGEVFEPAMLTMVTAIRFGDERSESGDEVVRKAAPAVIPQREMAFTQAHARQHLADFGYDLRPVKLSLKERFLFNVLDRPANLASMSAWRTLQAIRS